MTTTEERFIAASTIERLRIARDPSAQAELSKLLGPDAYLEYRRIAARLDEKHLAFGGPPNVVFVPGVMGSLLGSGTRGGVWWIDARTRDRIDSLRLSPDGLTDAEPSLAIGPLTTDPSYDAFLATLLEQSDLAHRIFAYDWRKSQCLAASALRDLIRDMHRDNGGAPVHIVAHSMGGLVVRAMLMVHREEIKPLLGRIVFIGTPHVGSPAIAGYLKNHMWGTDLMAVLGLYLSRETFRSLRGVLGLLPAPLGVYPGTRDSDVPAWRPDEGCDAYPHPCSNFDLYQADQWRLDLTGEDERALQDVLDATALHHRRMAEAHHRLPPEERADMLVIAGVGYQTLFRLAYEPGFLGLWEKAAKVRERVTDDPHREGDGRVPVASAMLDGVDVRFVKGEHGSLPNLPTVMDEVLRFLRGAPLELPRDVGSALAGHLARDDASPAPHLDGSERIRGFTDDPGYWDDTKPTREVLDSLESALGTGGAPGFARLRIL